MTIWLWIIALIVAILFPGLALAFGGSTRDTIMRQPQLKNYVYRVSAIQLVILMLITLSPFLFGRYTLDTIGLAFFKSPFQVFTMIAVPMIFAAVIYYLPLPYKLAGWIWRKNVRVRFLLPHTQSEYKHMVSLSYAAGICEEIIYRGFLFWFLSYYIPFYAAIILANLPFALSHLTSTGLKNSTWAFLLGILFSIIYLYTDSLWGPIVLHTMIDMLAATGAFRAHSFLKKAGFWEEE